MPALSGQEEPLKALPPGLRWERAQDPLPAPVSLERSAPRRSLNRPGRGSSRHSLSRLRTSGFLLFQNPPHPEDCRRHMPADAAGGAAAGAASQRRPDAAGCFLKCHLNLISALIPQNLRRLLLQILVGPLHRPLFDKPARYASSACFSWVFSSSIFPAPSACLSSRHPMTFPIKSPRASGVIAPTKAPRSASWPAVLRS